ncbi:MAG TPA: hypothetical protein VFE57_02425, partial [Cyclobacteriaceae bacterium]|nr:hypothetical protein [Cyclobacteriaceae bacterium]
TYAFTNEILVFSNTHAKEIIDINKKAEEHTIQQVLDQSGKIKKGVRFKLVPLEKINGFITYDFIKVVNADKSVKYSRTGNIIKVDGVNYHAKFEAEIESTLPRGYVIPAAFTAIVDNLKKHGVKVDQLTKAQSFSGEVFSMEKLEKASQSFQGHAMAQAQGKFTAASRKFKKGDYIVDMAQPLSNLIFYLLEPQSDDGLVTWNFFDEYISKNQVNNQPVEYPVFKYYK